MARITQLAEQRQVPIRVAVLGVLRCEMGAARSRPSGVFGPVLSPPWHGCYSKAAREEERRFRTHFRSLRVLLHEYRALERATPVPSGADLIYDAEDRLALTFNPYNRDLRLCAAALPVMQEKTELWKQLCAQAAVEQDPKKLLVLVEQINELVLARQVL